jgi:hypothetical protein
VASKDALSEDQMKALAVEHISPVWGIDSLGDVARKKAIIKRQVNSFELKRILVFDFFAFNCNKHGP